MDIYIHDFHSNLFQSLLIILITGVFHTHAYYGPYKVLSYQQIFQNVIYSKQKKLSVANCYELIY